MGLNSYFTLVCLVIFKETFTYLVITPHLLYSEREPVLGEENEYGKVVVCVGVEGASSYTHP